VILTEALPHEPYIMQSTLDCISGDVKCEYHVKLKYVRFCEDEHIMVQMSMDEPGLNCSNGKVLT
jgi:hypothetical protein